MNTLRGIISLSTLSFLVAVAGTSGHQALATAAPQVVWKKIQAPPQSRDNAAQAVAVTLAPKADIARNKENQRARPIPSPIVPVAELNAKSSLTPTPTDIHAPLKALQESLPAKTTAKDAPELRSLPKPEVEPAAVPAVAVSPAPPAVLAPAAETPSPAGQDAETSATVASVTVPEDRPPAILTGTEDGIRGPYNPLGKIDPFEPLFQDEPELEPVESKREKRIPRTPLENIDLGQLKLVGVILASSGNRALVQEASGKGYIIKEGTYIGMNSGKVTEIKNDRVIVEEEIEDVVGKPIIRNKELVLPKPPGE